MIDGKKENGRINAIRKHILLWYAQQGREGLPWRRTKNMYKIAVAEIMLQQTNVPKVIEKYKDFLRIFPTVHDLAQAQQSEVVQQWRGLGYNRRAIHLHKMAQQIVEKYGGRFPSDHAMLITLPGIGPYTSRSIPIFAKNTDIATRDVNIDRIMTRIHKDPSASLTQITQWIERYLPPGRSRDWHNALMDFASIICTKRAPLCQQCPIKELCKSFPMPQEPVSKKKKEVGRMECGRHVPRRIYRGRIVEFLRAGSAGPAEIGLAVKRDWNMVTDMSWLREVLHGLKKEHMIDDCDDMWSLH